ncbi:beta family protein [Shewanella sp.]|uniref:beta family protein n=1 Tax=Shewanella sp. TaxID=50422 RepID=UPI004053F8F2
MNFSDYDYVPTIRTRGAELLGIKHLKPASKLKILPQVRLCRINTTDNATGSLDKWLEAHDGPAIIQLEHSNTLRIEDTQYNSLLSPEGNFDAWANFIDTSKQKNQEFIPGLMYNDQISKRDYINQLKRFEKDFGRMVFNFNPMDKRALAAASTAASVVNDLSNILFILDSGQISRERQMASLNATISAMNELRQIDPSVDIVSSGTSFPKNFPPYLTQSNSNSGVIPMLEWDNYHSFGGRKFAIYGDYAAIHGEFYKGSFAQFVARIDYPTPSEWIFERFSPKDPKSCDRSKLYIDAAKKIITNESWDNELEAWGVDIIRKASEGDTTSFNAPAKWISVRLNLHVERILQFIEDGVVAQNISDEFDDSDDLNW